ELAGICATVRSQRRHCYSRRTSVVGTRHSRRCGTLAVRGRIGRLLAHMRRWERLGLVGGHFVEFNGKPNRSVKTAFSRALRLAGLSSEGGRIVPHTLRHTAATWLMQRGVSIWQAAGYLGMSPEILDRVYGHHS